MTTSNWLRDQMARLMSQSAIGGDGAKPATVRSGSRSLAQRVDGVVHKGKEALSPRELRRIPSDLESVFAQQISEVGAARHASDIARGSARATVPERMGCLLLLSERFAHDPVGEWLH